MFIESGTTGLTFGISSEIRSGVGSSLPRIIQDTHDLRVGPHVMQINRRQQSAKNNTQAENVDERSNSMPKSIVENWNTLALSGITVQKFEAIYKLALLRDGWRGGKSRALQSRSLSQFLGFWINNRSDATAPHLTLSPNGHLIAQWYKNAKRNLMLEFMTDNCVYVGLIEGEYEYNGIDNDIGVSDFLRSRRALPLKWK